MNFAGSLFHDLSSRRCPVAWFDAAIPDAAEVMKAAKSFTFQSVARLRAETNSAHF